MNMKENPSIKVDTEVVWLAQPFSMCLPLFLKAETYSQ